MAYSFLSNLFNTIKIAVIGEDSSEPKQPSFNDVNPLSNSDSCSTKITETSFDVEIEEYEIINEKEYEEDFEFINLPDEREVHASPSDYSIEESIAEIAGFHKEKLLEMCTFSKMTYGNNDSKLSASGYKTKAEFINEGYHVIPFYYKSRRQAGFIFAKDGEVSIAYRGTQGVGDVITDANVMFATSEFLPEGGRMHCGFYRAFKDSWPSLYKELKRYGNEQKSEIKDLKINLTGHSMGGALAKIAALCLNKTENAQDLHVAAFGDPRVFDFAASEIYNNVLGEKTIRVTQHRQDPVPAVAPGCAGYAHVGAQLRVEKSPEKWFHQIDGYYNAIGNMKNEDFKSNSSVSLFYYPSKVVGTAICGITAPLQHCFAGARRAWYGESWIEQVKRGEQLCATSMFNTINRLL